MKKKQSLRNLLGLTQDDLALILKVERSRLAKYEAGSRDLPLEAKKLLSEMIKHINGEMAETKSLAGQYKQNLKSVERMVKENEYQQMLIAREIESLEAKYNGKLKALQVVDFLALRNNIKDPQESAILRSIANKALKGLKSQGLDRLFQLKLKHEMLQLEKLLLDLEIRKTTRALENIGRK